MTNNTSLHRFRLTAGALLVGLLVGLAGCGGSGNTPNPDLKVPVSTATEADVKAGRGGVKQPGKT